MIFGPAAQADKTMEEEAITVSNILFIMIGPLWPVLPFSLGGWLV